MAELKLWYFIEGEHALSKVIISRDKRVVHLREEIREQCRNSYGPDAGSLVLLKVEIDDTQYTYDAIEGLRAPDDATVMPMGTRLGELWPDEPNNDHIHICVRLPGDSEPTRNLKRTRKEDGEAAMFLFGRIATLAPSVVATCDVAYFIMRGVLTREGPADDRPRPNDDHLPIALSYHGFGHFLDVANGAPMDPMLDIDWPRFERSVDAFMASMNIYYDSDKRRDQALCHLNDIFKHCLARDTQPLAAGKVFNEHCSDGHVLGPANTIEVALQVQNELCSSDVEPTIKLSAFYTQSLKDDSTKEVISRFSFPALGVVVIGSYVGFYALAYERRTRLVALTPLIPMTAESGNDWTRTSLLNAFRAACILRYHIHEDTRKFYAAKEESLPIPENLPYVNEVPASPESVASASPSVIRFHIQMEAYQGETTRYENRFLYFATLDSPDNPNNELRLDKVVVVKLTRRYVPELHWFCAMKGCAPQLLGYGTIPGGWRVVVMEWIDQQESYRRIHARDHLPAWSKALKSLVNDFHAEGWVHGDLRSANFMVRDEEPERALLVDYDWGGNINDGPIYYPTALLNEELRKPGHPGDLLITKEHDDHVLASTLEKLEKSKDELTSSLLEAQSSYRRHHDTAS